MLFFFFYRVTKHIGTCTTGTSLTTHHSIDRQELVASFKTTMPFSYASRDDAGDVDWWVLLFSTHHIKSKPLICLGQLHHPWVWVTLAGCKCCHCGLVGTREFKVSVKYVWQIDSPMHFQAIEHKKALLHDLSNTQKDILKAQKWFCLWM